MPGREDIFQKAMNEGHSAAWDQEWSKAVAAYRRALEESPDNPKALGSLGHPLVTLPGFNPLALRRVPRAFACEAAVRVEPAARHRIGRRFRRPS